MSYVKPSLYAAAAAMLAAVATHGKGFVESLHAAWLFLRLVSADMPLGLASFLLALGLSTLVVASLRTHVPHSARFPAHARTLGIEAFVLLVGIVTMYVQLPTLLGVLLGVVAGLGGPLMHRMVAAAAATLRGQASCKPPESP
ncbi:hypothetical protein [Luteimonas terrae]|uniref:Uncharacterized protein n=1 Tax=Luteimonas terrae TaxID=1530191 RepID=A0ABU1XXP1_9GAMM|nr:hypothetical protein [Luteimonas terrae]MDR7193363.1 hypothetical protein [Luteimonas terrae]